MGLTLLGCWFLKAHIPAALIGCWITNPLTAPAILAADIIVGNWASQLWEQVFTQASTQSFSGPNPLPTVSGSSANLTGALPSLKEILTAPGAQTKIALLKGAKSLLIGSLILSFASLLPVYTLTRGFLHFLLTRSAKQKKK